MPSISGTVAIGAAATEEFPTFGSDSADADYGVLLTRLKAFLCGHVSKPAVGGSNVGDGSIHSFDMTDATNAVADSWTVTFSDDETFDVVGVSEGALGPFTLVLGTDRDYRSYEVSFPGGSFVVTEGDTPFEAGDEFTFTTTVSPLTTQAYEVVADTSRGVGSTIMTSKEVLAYRRSTGEEVIFEQFGQYSNEGSSPRYPVAFSELQFYDQESLNATWYIDFFTSTQYKLKDAAGNILASAALGDFVDYRSPTFSVGFRVVKSGADVVYSHANAGVVGVPLTAKYNAASGTATGTRTTLRVKPTVNSSSTYTRVTRVVVLKAKGLAGADSIYFTFAQRVGGVADGDRYFLDCHLSRAYDPLLEVFNQVNMSPAGRVKNHQTAAVTYHFIADGRSFKLLSLLTGGDYQSMAGGLFLPHSTPTAYPWPGFVLGTIGNGLFSPIPGDAPVDRKDESPGYCPGVNSLSPPVNGYDKSSTLWVCLPTSVWLHGANHEQAVESIGAAGSRTQSLGAAAEDVEAIYTAPWIYRDSDLTGSDPGYIDGCRISPQAYGDSTVKVFFPGMIVSATALLSGVLGEFPGIFFIGESSYNPVVPGDIIEVDSVDHLVWSGTTVQPQFSAVLAVFAKE